MVYRKGVFFGEIKHLAVPSANHNNETNMGNLRTSRVFNISAPIIESELPMYLSRLLSLVPLH